MEQHSNISIEQLALQRDRYRHLSDEEWRWFLQQVEGRERTADKLPTFAAIDDWWYPVRLSCEQCSSELTARYKAQIVLGTWSNGTCLDLTGGYGVDAFFLSELFAHTDYVEQNTELCRIAAHNFALAHKNISVHNTSAEAFLSSPLHGGIEGGVHLIFLDPARRDSHGGKVFRLADCTPNVVELLPLLLTHLDPNGRILLKLSPMLDITQAIKELSAVSTQHSGIIWDVYIVAVKNEVKEVLLMSRNTELSNYRYTDLSNYRDTEPTITAIDLSKKEQAFTFTREEEREAISLPLQGELEGAFLYEPNAAILKAGAYKLIASRFGLHKLDPNTHLYTSNTLVENFPGRVWRIKEAPFQLSPKGARDMQANVLTRNYPLTPEQLKKKLHLRDGGAAYVIACRVAGKPTVFLAERVEDIHSES